MKQPLELDVNGRLLRVTVDPQTPLLFVLRNELGLFGAKLGCGLEQCGACVVLVDEQPSPSCVRAVGSLAGCRIVTVEGLADHPVGRRVQQAFFDATAAQCGYCTPGLVVAATALLLRHSNPGDPELAAALDPHLCRCGAHASVLRAMRGLRRGSEGK